MNIKSQIAKNVFRTYLIMALFVLFITTVGYVYGKASGQGSSFGTTALVISGAMSLLSYFFSDRLVLATTHAREVKLNELPELHQIVENLAKKDGINTPRLYVVDDLAPNAFATGRDYNNAVVCVTTGILERLNKVELEGVIAHELSHVKNYDIRLMAIVSVLVGFIAMASHFFMWGGGGRRSDDDRNGNLFAILGLIFAILTPIIATLIQLAISRKGEFLADASGALLTRYPDGLADALEKIAHDPHSMRTASPATAHLFIANPFKGKEATGWVTSLFNTHPPIEERIKILRSM